MAGMEVDTLPDTAQCKSCAQVVPVSDCVRVNKHRLSEKVTAYKCRSCNRLQSRINRMQASSDMQIAFPDAAAREAFFKKHQESFGEDLKAALEVVTIETRSHTSTDKLAEEGDWLDEVDLTEKYKSKPEQLKSMLQNAKRMEHPTRKVTLFFDANFKSTATEELEKRCEERAVATSETFKKAPPKPKAKACLASKKKKAKPPPSKKQMDNLRAAAAKAEAVAEQMADLSAQAAENSDFVPKGAFETLVNQRAHMEAAVAAAHLALETTGWAGNPTLLMMELKKCRTQLQSTAQPFKGLLKMAGAAAKSGA